MFEIRNVKISDLHLNTGQVEGLPKNPRFIKDRRFKALKKSIEDAPEMLSLREIIAYDNNGELVVIGGNMRLRALKDLGYKECVCKILDKNTPVEKLREYAIKDNVGFGEDDYDILANEWDFEELRKFGMETNLGDVRGELLQDIMNTRHLEKEDYFRPVFLTVLSFATDEERKEWEDNNKNNLKIL